MADPAERATTNGLGDKLAPLATLYFATSAAEILFARDFVSAFGGPIERVKRRGRPQTTIKRRRRFRVLFGNTRGRLSVLSLARSRAPLLRARLLALLKKGNTNSRVKRERQSSKLLAQIKLHTCQLLLASSSSQGEKLKPMSQIGAPLSRAALISGPVLSALQFCLC